MLMSAREENVCVIRGRVHHVETAAGDDARGRPPWQQLPTVILSE